MIKQQLTYYRFTIANFPKEKIKALPSYDGEDGVVLSFETDTYIYYQVYDIDLFRISVNEIGIWNEEFEEITEEEWDNNQPGRN